MSIKPPLLPRLLLRLIPSERDRALIRSDLDEEFARHILPKRGRARARRWYWEYACRSIADSWQGERIAAPGTGNATSRRQRFSHLASGWATDFRHAVRLMRRERVVSFTVVLTMVVGISATTAIMTVLRGVFLKPLPFPEPGQIVQLDRSSAGTPAGWGVVGFPDMQDWRTRNVSMEEIAGWTYTGLTLEGDHDPVRITGVRVTDGLERVLGITPALGRFFAPAEYQFGGNHVVVLSHTFWRDRFGGDPTILGRSVTLDGVAHEVVGVMWATEFSYPIGAQLWVPMAFAPDAWQIRIRGASWLTAVGRVRTDGTLDAAQAELTALQDVIRRESPRESEGQDGVALTALQDVIVAPVRPVMILLVGAVGAALVIAAANVVVLLLGRATRRAPEFSIRSILGGGRRRLMRQLITETLVLCAIGGGLGIALSPVFVDAIMAFYPGDLPRAAGIRLDLPVLAAASLAIIASACAAGAIPVLYATKFDATHGARARGATSGRAIASVRATLTAVQIALSVALLAIAASFGRTLWNLHNVDPGFRSSEVLTFRLSPPASRYEAGDGLAAFHTNAVEAFAAIPGVERAGAVNFLPLTPGEWGGGFRIVGGTEAGDVSEHPANVRVTTPEYHGAMGIALVRGRLFTQTDDASAGPVAVVNRAASRAFGVDPIGRTIQFDGRTWDVIGVVEDVRDQSLSQAPRPELHVPLAQLQRRSMWYALRTQQTAGQLVPAVRGAVRTLDPALPLVDMNTMAGRIESSLGPARFRAGLVSGLGAVALTLALIGIYGVIAFHVTQRTREIGIRMALGQPKRSVLGTVLGSAARLTAVGVMIGSLIPLAAGGPLEQFLFDVNVRDGTTLAAIAVLLLVVGIGSAIPPAVRAGKTDPAIAMREE